MKKVFVSSKQGELDPERAALHQALQSSEWDNFTFEWWGAFPDSARDVYLKQVAEADVYLGIFCAAYSQATVDEYREARRLGKPILIYLKDSAERDAALTKFITDELYPAHKCQSFKTTDELVSHLPDVCRALDAEVQKHQCQAYLDALVTQTRLLELGGILETGEEAQPKLQDVFIPLNAVEEIEERDERQPKDRREREPPIKITRRVTVNEALREHRNLMILGDPGAGKSTLLRYLTLVAATTIADNRPQTADASGGPSSVVVSGLDLGLPILIRLSSFARSGQSFVEYFETYAKTQLHVSLGEKFFERALEDGKTIVCLDGLDEVFQPAQRLDIRNQITAFASNPKYRNNRFIVTSRVAGYDGASLDKRAFAHHTIVPFGENEIQSFAEKWYMTREREPEQAKTCAASLFNDLKSNERLLKLAENPLTLTIIALVHQRAQGKLPEARVELYDRCAETLIEEWDKWKGLAPEDRARPYYQLRRRLLERAAYWMHIESQETDIAQISKHGLETKVAEFLVEDMTLNLSENTARIEAKQFVALATSRTGILVEREQGAVSFIHLTFQEYFAASDLYWRYRKTPDALWQVIQPHLYDSRWLEVILLLLGRLNAEGDTPSIIVEKILCEHDKFDDVIHRDLFLAARCVADGVNMRESIQNEIVETLLKFANSNYPHIYFPKTLHSDSIQALGNMRGSFCVGNGLITLAEDEKIDDDVRCAAVQALGKLRSNDDTVIQGLLALAQDAKINSKMRSAAAQALGQLGRTDDAVIQGLVALAQDAKDNQDILIAAAQALVQLGHPKAAVNQELVALSQDLKDSVWQDTSEKELRQIRTLGRAQEQATQAIVQFSLAIAQQSKEAGLRLLAARELGVLGRTDEAARLLLVLAHDEKVKRWVRCDAARTLGQLGRADDAVPLLLALAQDARTEDNDRGYIIQALGQLGRKDDAVIQGLLAFAQDTKVNSYVRSTAAQALRQLGRTDDAVRLLLVLAQDAKVESDQRCSVAKELVLLGHTDEALELLLAFAQDRKTEGHVRRNATQALGKLGREDAQVALALLKLSKDKETRDEVYAALKQVAGNLRYTELDNGQNRIKQTGKKIPKPIIRNGDKREHR